MADRRRDPRSALPRLPLNNVPSSVSNPPRLQRRRYIPRRATGTSSGHAIAYPRPSDVPHEVVLPPQTEALFNRPSVTVSRTVNGYPRMIRGWILVNSRPSEVFIRPPVPPRPGFTPQVIGPRQVFQSGIPPSESDAVMFIRNLEWGPSPKDIPCPNCLHVITTEMRPVRDTLRWELSSVRSLIGSYCIASHYNLVWDTDHYCPNCETILGRYQYKQGENVTHTV